MSKPSLLSTLVQFTGPKFSAVSQSLCKALIRNNGSFSPSEKLRSTGLSYTSWEPKVQEIFVLLLRLLPCIYHENRDSQQTARAASPPPGKAPDGGKRPLRQPPRQTQARGAAGSSPSPLSRCAAQRSLGRRGRASGRFAEATTANRDGARQESTRSSGGHAAGGKRPARRRPGPCPIRRASSRCSRSSPSPGRTRH